MILKGWYSFFCHSLLFWMVFTVFLQLVATSNDNINDNSNKELSNQRQDGVPEFLNYNYEELESLESWFRELELLKNTKLWQILQSRLKVFEKYLGKFEENLKQDNDKFNQKLMEIRDEFIKLNKKVNDILDPVATNDYGLDGSEEDDDANDGSNNEEDLEENNDYHAKTSNNENETESEEVSLTENNNIPKNTEKPNEEVEVNSPRHVRPNDCHSEEMTAPIPGLNNFLPTRTPNDYFRMGGSSQFFNNPYPQYYNRPTVQDFNLPIIPINFNLIPPTEEELDYKVSFVLPEGFISRSPGKLAPTQDIAKAYAFLKEINESTSLSPNENLKSPLGRGKLVKLANLYKALYEAIKELHDPIRAGNQIDNHGDMFWVNIITPYFDSFSDILKRMIDSLKTPSRN